VRISIKHLRNISGLTVEGFCHRSPLSAALGAGAGQSSKVFLIRLVFEKTAFFGVFHNGSITTIIVVYVQHNDLSWWGCGR